MFGFESAISKKVSQAMFQWVSLFARSLLEFLGDVPLKPTHPQRQESSTSQYQAFSKPKQYSLLLQFSIKGCVMKSIVTALTARSSCLWRYVWARRTFSCVRACKNFCVRPAVERYLLVSSGIRSSYMMAKWLRAGFQWRIGIVHFFDAS